MLLKYTQPSIVNSPVPKSNAVLSATERKSPDPSNLPLPPFVAALYSTAGLNGEKAWTETLL
jgi:hypothetical protein